MSPRRSIHVVLSKLTVGGPACSAFTLIELLAVISLIGILVAISVPIVFRVRLQAAKSTSASNLRQLGIALQTYASDNRGVLPYVTDNPFPSPSGEPVSTNVTWDLIIQEAGYTGPALDKRNRWVDTKDKEIFRSPNDDIARTNNAPARSYCVNRYVMPVGSRDPDHPPVENPKSIQRRFQNAQKSLALVVLLFERPTSVNIFAQPGSAAQYSPAVSGAEWGTVAGSPNYLFGDGGNYLFCDGHVEFLDLRDYGTTPASASSAMGVRYFEPM